MCQAPDTALVAIAAGSTTPTSDGARGMSVEAVRCARRLSPSARPKVRYKTLRAHAVCEQHARVRQRWCVPRTDKPPAGPHLGIVLTTGLPDGQGERSIQIDGLRVPCEWLQAPGDQLGLASRSQWSARVDPISWSVYHTGPVSRDAVRGRIRPTYFPSTASRSAHGPSRSAVAHPSGEAQRELAAEIQRYGRVDRRSM